MDGSTETSAGASTDPQFDRPDEPEATAATHTEESKTYRGTRTSSHATRCQVTVNGTSLARRYDLLSASPTGFEWGYGGSGPAQLAIALLADCYSDAFACANYQRFKRDVIADLPDDSWTLTEADIRRYFRQTEPSE